VKTDTWHRRQAIMLASQLPEGHEDIMIVLRLMSQLVNDFLAEPEQPAKPVVVQIK
jgi:hypothetical protein